MLAVVTGASGGIGSAIAERVSYVVDDLVLTSRRAPLLNEVAPSGPATVHRVPADVTSRDVIPRLTDTLRPLDKTRVVIVNAAGSFGPVDAPGTVDIEGWEETMRTHVVGSLMTMTHFIPLMRRSGWGRVINVSSAQSLHGPDPVAGAYATAKSALNVMTAGAAMQVEGSEVSVCAIHPGDVDTAMAADIRAKATEAGDSARHLAEWAEVIGAGGGDDAAEAGDLVAEIIERPAAWSNGRFLLVPSSRDRHPDEGWSMPVGPAFD